MNVKPAVLLSYDTAGTPACDMVGTPETVLAEFRERMKAGGNGAHMLVAMTGRGIEKRAKFTVEPEQTKKKAGK